MTVFRIHKTANYTVMANYHFKEREMSLKSKGMLSLMLALPDTWCYSISGLTKLSKDGKDSVMSALQELEKFGYLTRKQMVNSKGQFCGVEYHIFEEPQRENPDAALQDAAIQKAAKPNAENREQLNTNSIKEKEDKDIKVSSTKGEAAITEEQLFETLLTIEDEELAELYRAYVEWRNTTDSPLTHQGLLMLMKRCERLSGYKVEVQRAMVETALIQGWRNVFSPKDEEKRGTNPVAEEHAKILFGE